MPETSVEALSASEYNKLKSDLAQILKTVHSDEDEASNAAMVQGYWKIGDRIAREKISNSAAYHNPILRDLSDDLDVDVRSLQYCVRFRDSYPRKEGIPELSWTNLRLLIGVTDGQERAFYEDLAIHEKWTSRQLTSAIANDRYLEARKSKHKNRVKLERPTNPDYRYRVEVRRVIDADTLIVDIDVGFEMLKRQTMRLARVDCPERGNAQGELARRYVQSELANAQRVVIQSAKSDIHGRYIAHVFYTDRKLGIHATIEHGEYLNQKLLDRGYARAH